MDRTFSNTFVIKRIALGVMLSQMLTLQADSVAEGFEMGASLLSIPAKIAARHCAYKDKTKAASMLYLTADTLNICRDVLYFWNQSQEANRHSRGADQRLFNDGIGCAAVNGAMTIRDLTKWAQHLSESIGLRSAIQAAVDDEELIDFDDEAATVGHADDATDGAATVKPGDPALDEQKISQLAYAWQVVALPSLEGLAAFAVAFTQHDGGPTYRRIATAAHAFVRLLDEQAMLKPNSPHTKALYALLMVNAIWLAYEVYGYYNLPTPVPPVGPVVVHNTGTNGGQSDPASAAAVTGGAATAGTNGGQLDPASVAAVTGGVTTAGTGGGTTTALEDRTTAANTTNGVGTVAPVPAPAHVAVPVVRVNRRTDTTASCRTCGTAFGEKDTIRVPLFQCGHAVCRDCLAGQIRNAAGEHKTAVSACPFVGARGERCNGVIVEQDIPHAIDPQDKDFEALMASYHDSSIEKGAATIQNVRHCPGVNCKYMYFVNPNDKIDMTCPLCHATYCSYCLQNWNDPLSHPAGPCVAPGTAPAGDEELRQWLEAHTRPCPHCGVAIEKNEHCNHMTCRQCGHEFCWLCGEPCLGGRHFDNCQAARRAGMSGTDLWLQYHNEDNSGDVEWARNVRARFAAANQSQSSAASAQPQASAAASARQTWNQWN